MTRPTDAEIVDWAIEEIRDLDELARSMIPGYESLGSDDMDRLERLRKIREDLKEHADETP